MARVEAAEAAKGPSFDDTMEDAKLRRQNPLAATTRNSCRPEKTKLNEKDNLLKYQISDDREENELLEGVMGPSVEELEAMTGTMKRRL